VDDIRFAQVCETELLSIIEKDSTKITMKRFKEGTTWWAKIFSLLSYHSIRVLLFLFTIGLRNKE
jgi:hypothetical protein